MEFDNKCFREMNFDGNLPIFVFKNMSPSVEIMYKLRLEKHFSKLYKLQNPLHFYSQEIGDDCYWIVTAENSKDANAMVSHSLNIFEFMKRNHLKNNLQYFHIVDKNRKCSLYDTYPCLSYKPVKKDCEWQKIMLQDLSDSVKDKNIELTQKTNRQGVKTIYITQQKSSEHLEAIYSSIFGRASTFECKCDFMKSLTPFGQQNPAIMNKNTNVMQKRVRNDLQLTKDQIENCEDLSFSLYKNF